MAKRKIIKQQMFHEPSPGTWVEIDLKAIRHNIKKIKQSAHPAKIIAVIKEDAYGHGLVRVWSVLQKKGIRHFAVSNVIEGTTLRQSGCMDTILLLENTLERDIPYIIHNRLMPAVFTWEFVKILDQSGDEAHKIIPVHVKIDSGMGRLGIWHKEALKFVERIWTLKHVRVDGIFTHLSYSDDDNPFVRKQIKIFENIVMELQNNGYEIPKRHVFNSMGTLIYKNPLLNFVRPGIIIYGLYPSSAFKRKVQLKSAMTVKSRIIHIKEINKGRSISYGRTFIAKKGMRVATVPIGYTDGYSRAFSNRASVLVNGQKCPILGRVTMNQVVIDVSKVKNIRLGMKVTIMGSEGRQTISSEHLAQLAGTINYDISCSFGGRLPQFYK